MKPRMKNKTLAAWLAFLGGPLGLHRFYLHGLGDMLGWLLPIPTALGLYGVERARLYGLDDGLSADGHRLRSHDSGKMERAIQCGRAGRHAFRPDWVDHHRRGGRLAAHRQHGADGQHRLQLPALFRASGRGRPEDFAVADIVRRTASVQIRALE
jgi:hypothetical protein